MNVVYFLVSYARQQRKKAANIPTTMGAKILPGNGSQQELRCGCFVWLIIVLLEVDISLISSFS